MNIRELIQYMSAESELSIRQAAFKLGKDDASAITHVYRTKDGFRLNKFIDVCDVFGYDVVVVKKRDKEYLDTTNGIRITKE